MSDIELASGVFRNPVTTFPARWGEPPDDYEARCQWIKENVATEMEYQRGARKVRTESARFWNDLRGLENIEIRKQMRAERWAEQYA